MGTGNKFAGSALVLAAIAGFMPAAVAESTADSRLMFDPAALDQSPAGSGRDQEHPCAQKALHDDGSVHSQRGRDTCDEGERQQ